MCSAEPNCRNIIQLLMLSLVQELADDDQFPVKNVKHEMRDGTHTII